MATGEIVTLYENKEKTIAAYPRTLSEAVKHVEDDGTVRSVSEVINDLKNSVSDGKELLATAITNKKVATEPTDSFATMASNIDSLKLGSGNATTADVLSGKTFTNSDGIEYTGNMVNNGTTKPYTAMGNYQTDSIYVRMPQGFYTKDGGGGDPYVTVVRSAFGNATLSDVISGKTFTSSTGLNVAGTYAPSASYVTTQGIGQQDGTQSWTYSTTAGKRYLVVLMAANTEGGSDSASCSCTNATVTQLSYTNTNATNGTTVKTTLGIWLVVANSAGTLTMSTYVQKGYGCHRKTILEIA